MNFYTHLECGKCGKTHSKEEIQNLCRECGKPLLARYDLKTAKKELSKETVMKRAPTMWRYKELLPIEQEEHIITLNEGFTPLVLARELNKKLGCTKILVKDESVNPTGSFKARGLCAAISKAKEIGVKGITIPSAGNAAVATSAYARLANIPVHVFMPRDTPQCCMNKCKSYGANVHEIDGLINDCGKIAAKKREELDYFDISTLKEPYRIEGKKTMGYEVAEQLNWELPDVIIYPTGGGTGIIGMWKAFDEMEQLGWIGSKRPRMVSVQAENCAPIVKAFNEGKEHADLWENAHTIAPGLRVPAAIGDFLIINLLKESNGIAITVSDEEITKGAELLKETEKMYCSPESGATVAALKKLLEMNWIKPDEKVILFNTGSQY